MTLATDYALAGVTGWFAWSLYRAREAQAARSIWAAAFTALALGAALGGTYHGFAAAFAEGALYLLWTTTVLAVGIGTFGMVVGSAIATTTGAPRKLVVFVAIAKLVAYSAWMIGHDDYVFVIADSGIAIAIVGALHACAALRHRERASLWMLGGVTVSVLAAAVQASSFSLHRHFNHNDLYHVIQIVAMWLFYRGALQLRDRSMLKGTE